MAAQGASNPIERAALFAILALVAIVNLAPHWSPHEARDALLPVHIDEYYHWGFARAIQREGRIDVADPYLLDGPEPLLENTRLHERGFQTLLAVYQEATGIPWAAIFVLGPTLVALGMSFAVYVIARPWGGGLAGALWVAAIPTSLRYLGPGFLVPIAVALPVFLVACWILLRGRGAGSALAVAIMGASLWTLHAVAALVLLVAVAASAIVQIVRRPWHAVAGTAGAAAAAILLAQFVPREVVPLVSEHAFLIDLPVLRTAGPLLFATASVGAAALALSPDVRTREAGSVFAITLLSSMALMVFGAASGLTFLGLFERSVLVAHVVASVLAGVGTGALARVLTRPARLRRFATVALGLLLVGQGVAVSAAAERWTAQPLYQLVSHDQWRAYEAAADLPDYYDLALVDGPSTMAFTIATGRPTLYAVQPGLPAYPEHLDSFFERGSIDTFFIVGNGVSIVVTGRPVLNPDLEPLGGGVYKLRDDYARRLAGLPP